MYHGNHLRCFIYNDTPNIPTASRDLDVSGIFPCARLVSLLYRVISCPRLCYFHSMSERIDITSISLRTWCGLCGHGTNALSRGSQLVYRFANLDLWSVLWTLPDRCSHPCPVLTSTHTPDTCTYLNTILGSMYTTLENVTSSSPASQPASQSVAYQHRSIDRSIECT